MNEVIIEALLRLFAIITNREEEKVSGSGRSLVETYLAENFNRELVDKYLTLYHQYIDYYHKEKQYTLIRDDGSKRIFNKDYVSGICNLINQENDLTGKFLLTIQLLEFIKKDDTLTEGELSFVDYVADHLRLNKSYYEDLKSFCLFSTEKVKDKNQLLVINGKDSYPDAEIKHLKNENQTVVIWVFRIRPINTFVFRYSGPRNLYLNGHKIAQGRTTVLSAGGVLKTSRIRPIYYSKVIAQFIQKKGEPKIVFSATEVDYKFSKHHYGLHKFSFCEESGQLVGVLGGSGVGKSTFLNVLNGKLPPNSGKITINGFDIHEEKEYVNGVIGYVPQDDLLMEELTVYENLYYNAKLCFSNFSEEDIREKIDQALVDFDLVEARDLVVGDPLKKIISGGQRKRLNIALELIREPSILFVDEPTSGLSSMDSEKVMNLLKRQTFKGKLVIANIHQPASDIYKMLDRLVIMDRGGYVIYNGNPMDAIIYFKKHANYINPEESECLSCGNVKTEQPLRIIEARMVNPSGKFSRKRKVDPQEWYQHYQEEIEQNEAPRCKRRQVKKHKIPKNFFKTPKRWKQVSIYMKRDLLSKIANRQYMTISLLEAPLLAVILGYFTKYMSGTENDPLAYVFSKNVNIPGYLFMSVLVALFIGLIQSSDEIFKDRKIVERERFLNLSKISYLSSKVFILFSLSAFQTIVYVLIGNYILEIEGLTFFYWLILFSTACFANALGLNLSAGLSSAVAIYVLIPLLLIPQILFSGVVVQFNKLPYHVNSYKYTPVIGDIMVSRWSYEALAVNQFKRNKYNEDIFPAELVRQNYAYLLYYFLPELHRQLAELSGEENHKKDYTRISLPGEFEKLNSKIEGLNVKPFDTDKFKNASGEIYQEAGLFLDKVEQVFQKEYAEASQRRETIIMEKIREAGGRDELVKMKQNYHNENLTDQLEGTNEMDKFKIIKGEIIQLDKPVYNLPDHKFGRAQFYASYKRVANGYMDTIAFNLIVIWVFIIILLLTLYFDVLKKLLFYFERVRLRKRFFRQLRNVGITVDNIKKNI